MKTETFKNRTKNETANSNGYRYAEQLLTNGIRVYTCHTSGAGRFTTNIDRTADTVSILETAGLRKGVDFHVGNDSPRGGKTGNYVELSSNGKTKMIN